MKAVGDKVILVDWGSHAQSRFEYYTYRGDSNIYIDKCDWAHDTLGNFGQEWYYGGSKFWFKTEEDLLAFTIRFPE
jgi:hypothetical protein